ncbi:hypothetical protein K7432_000167 [Basidiobolus ranarum]|uniref:RNA-dependent RNA polymerase n=1 Tax=Basidiobolus ranarum TaxID=34480 RepID=A0ABR2WBQ0_9FUNG
MKAAEIKKFFSTWGDVTYCDILKNKYTSNSNRAIVCFRPPPVSLSFMDENLQPLHNGRRGECLYMDLTTNTAQKLNLREKGESAKSQIRFDALDFSMGVISNDNRFVSAWKPSGESIFEIDYHKRIIYVKFRHKDQLYRVGVMFNEIYKGIVLDDSDTNKYVLYIQFSRPPFLWHKQDSLALLLSTFENWNEENSWQRASHIINQDSNSTEVDDSRISIGDFFAYRISLPLSNSYGELFKDSIDDLMRYNLVPHGVAVQPPTVTDISKLETIDIATLLPFKLYYLIVCLICAQKISLYSLSEECITYVNSLDPDMAEHIFMRMIETEDLLENPLTFIQQAVSRLSNGYIKLDEVPTYNTWIRRAIVTPSRIYYLPPTLEVSNRVVRHFHKQQDYFIRVIFSDEHFEKVGTNRLLYQPIFDRIEELMNKGFYLAGRHYRFLAFSSSQLREHCCWFFADTPDGIDVDFIRSWMGDFSEIKNVAKHAARMGQCFSSTRPVKTLKKEQIQEIPDVIRNGYLFSDGVGKISMSLAKEIADLYKRDSVSGAFQIRLGGYKGVLAVAPESEMGDCLVQLRPSQKKFNSDHRALEIIKTAEFMPAYLNRQVIVLLTTLGVPDSVFIALQEAYLREMEEIIHDEVLALKILALHCSSSWIIGPLRKMIQSGFLKYGDNFTKSILSLLRINVLKDIKYRARVPIELGAHLMGVMDETQTLRENQISLRFTDPKQNNLIRSYVGPALVVRNPCLHPGDIHMVEAVDCPQHHSLINCVVFSSQGSRDLPSQCSGGDLDGDTYMVLWDERLFPPRKVPPVSYTKQQNDVVSKVTIEDTAKFFVNYIVSDNLGEIANAHLSWADQSLASASSTECTWLVHLHSKAVDFVKTGIPAEFSYSLRPKLWPDFMEKPSRFTYSSVRALGKMYRDGAMKLQGKSRHPPITDVEEVQFDSKLIVTGYDKYVVEARRLKHEYDLTLKNVMNQFGIESEGEVVSGFIQSYPPTMIRKKEKTALRETLSNTINVIWRTFRKHFHDEFPKPTVKDERLTAAMQLERRRKASAWYYVTYNSNEISHQKNRYYYGANDETILNPLSATNFSLCYGDKKEKPIFISFPWIVHDILCEILLEATLFRKAN